MRYSNTYLFFAGHLTMLFLMLPLKKEVPFLFKKYNLRTRLQSVLVFINRTLIGDIDDPLECSSYSVGYVLAVTHCKWIVLFSI